MNILEAPYILALTGMFLMTPVASLAQEADENAEAPPVWATQCTSGARTSALNCVMEQRVIQADTRQTILSITIRVPGDTRAPVLMIQVPHGLYIPEGVTISVDDGAEAQYPVQTCEQSGCYIGTEVPDALLGSLQSGQTLNIKFQNLNREELNVPVPLKGFSEFYSRIQ